MEVKAFGTFIKKKDFIYRTNTYLQFGESDNILGTCILCNPGSSSLKDKKEHDKLVGAKVEFKYEVDGELVLDPAMKQLAAIIREIYKDELSGRVMIFNIFSLRNARMVEAVKFLENSDIDKELLFIDFKNYNSMFSDLPWTLIGWGCENNRVLNDEKEKWLEFIKENNITYFGNEGKRLPHYYHPLPRIHQKRIEYRETIVKQYNNQIDKKKLVVG